MNVWERARACDPEEYLKSVHPLRYLAAHLPDERARDLRTRRLQRTLELWRGAIFCHGLARVEGTKVFLVDDESEDHDVVTLRVQDGTKHFTPVQLKEVPPEKLNPNASLQWQLDKLTKYADSDTCVAICINREGPLTFSDLRVPPLRVRQVWLFGSTSPDGRDWFLYGDLKQQGAALHRFEYPGGMVMIE